MPFFVFWSLPVAPDLFSQFHPNTILFCQDTSPGVGNGGANDNCSATKSHDGRAHRVSSVFLSIFPIPAGSRSRPRKVTTGRRGNPSQFLIRTDADTDTSFHDSYRSCPCDTPTAIPLVIGRGNPSQFFFIFVQRGYEYGDPWSISILSLRDHTPNAIQSAVVIPRNFFFVRRGYG